MLVTRPSTMNSLKSFFLLFMIFFFKTSNVDSEKDVKSSLTFVIDDTGSMWNDIDQVKMGVNDIFDAVLKSNDSQIENFIVVTFNDPDVKTRTITQDRNIFKNTLNSISVDGGGDCPEYSMSGIEKALEVSLPGSYLYVCTDASALDYKRYKYVTALAQSKGSQVTFLLTGLCLEAPTDSSPGFKEYYDLARTTNGQVFQLGKTDIHDIIKYVTETVKGRRTPLARAEFPPGTHNLTYTVDNKTSDVMIAASGMKPKVDLTDPDGEKTGLEKVVEKENIAIFGTNVTKPGLYTVTMESESKSTVLVTGKTKLGFRYGFSTFTPTSIDDTATRPPADIKTHLSIQLVEADGVELVTVKYKDIDNNDITDEIPFAAIDEKRKLYVTDLIDTPKNMFKISIMCYDSASETDLVRASPTLIEPSTLLDPPKPTSPTVTIDGEPKIVAEYDAPLKLKCKIRAYPKPNVLWKVIETGTVVKSVLSVKELPYDYISIAEIDVVLKNETYGCFVTNEYGTVDKHVDVETINKYYFNVIEKPADTIIEYEKSGTINCNVEALPSANIHWFKDGLDIASELFDENLEVSANSTTLFIKSMQPALSGHYLCEAKNKLERQLFHFNIDITGIELPKVNKSIKRVYATKGSKIDMRCNVTAGKPKPTISWYFKHRPVKSFNETITIKNVDVKHAGIYRCVAANLRGSDFHDSELVIEYPPTITGSISSVKTRDGEKVFLKCDVAGVPKPNVRWFKNGALLSTSNPVHIYRDHSIKFKASLEYSGNYTCMAENKHGTDYKTTVVFVSVPVSIESPSESRVKVKVGLDILLPCRADGYPKPDIQWLFYNKDAKTPKILEEKSFALHLRRMQIDDQGYYVCKASNVGGSANITYEVQVLAPPVIENVYPDKTFRAVEGDLTLRIPCKATGSPKPRIKWMKNGLNIASGSKWFNIEDDGTLVIKNVEDLSSGAYICDAKNELGYKQEVYEVVVFPYPRPVPAKTTITVENGQSVFLNCDVPHKPLDLLRWYKDGVLIGEGEYELKNTTLTDSGVYTCRVSDFTKARTGSINVKVGFKPQFTSYVDEEIPFEEGIPTVLDCEAIADPKPQVAWYRDGKRLNDTDIYKFIDMAYDTIGEYVCEVHNKYGKITRNFSITAADCILDISNDFSRNQPLIYKSPLGWPDFDTSGGYLRIHKDQYISLFCPGNFQQFPRSYITAFCQGGANFKVNGKPNYKFKDLSCSDNIQPIMHSTNKSCHHSKGELIKIGYTAFGSFLEAYEVCFDKVWRVPIYAKHSMKHNLAGVVPTDFTWQESDLAPLNLDVMYNCNKQINYISNKLRKWFHSDDNCCFSRRQLVNPKDMVPGLSQMATFSNLNVVPHWSTCSTKNWEAVENSLRSLAKSISYELTIYTGVSDNLELERYNKRIWNAHLTNNKVVQAVPLYLWKIIQDPVTRSSLAVIQVNVPDLNRSEANKYVLCRDICDDINWLRNPHLRDVTKGYTYCCSLNEFIRLFDYSSEFEESFYKVLYDVASISEHSLT